MSKDLIREYVMADARVRVLSDKYGDSAKPKEFWDAQQERRLLAYRIAEELDPPAKIDTTLRGPVEVAGKDGVWLMYAKDFGLTYNTEHGAIGDVTWEQARQRGLAVRRLTPEDIGYRVRKWDEWSEEERDRWVWQRGSDGYKGDVDLAIEIATRQEDV